MKQFLGFLVCLVVFPLMSTAGGDVFCRYQLGEEESYGQVIGNTIHQLCCAPWDGGAATGHTVPVKKVKLLHPTEPTKIIGLSGSFKEAWPDGKKPFKTIRWFLKPPSTAASPGDNVELPAAVDELMVETELAIVIGKKVKNADLEEAKKAIFGYTLGNDIVGSVDSFHKVNGEPEDQEETVLPPALKQGDGFSPYGPFIYTDVKWNDLDRKLVVSNKKTGKKLVYEHNTSSFAYTPEKMVSDLSRVFALQPGDIIFMGTTAALPANAGDVMTVSVEGFESITNKVVKTP